jgi:hypothetical protein
MSSVMGNSNDEFRQRQHFSDNVITSFRLLPAQIEMERPMSENKLSRFDLKDESPRFKMHPVPVFEPSHADPPHGIYPQSYAN